MCPESVKRHSGFSLVTAIFLLVILASLGAFIVTISGVQQTSSALDMQGSRAYQAARAGIEWGTYQVLINTGAVAVDTSASAMSAVSSTTLTWMHTATGSNRLVIVGVSYIHASATVSVTYGGVAMTSVGSAVQGGDDRMQMFRLVNPPTGAQTVTVTFSVAVIQKIGGSVSMTGVNQTTPLGTFVSATGFTTTPSVTVTSGAGELVIDTLAGDTGVGTTTVNAGQTQQWNLKPANTGAGSTKAGAASVTMGWTFSTADNWSHGAVSVKPAVGFCGSGPSTQILTGMGGTLSGFTTTVDCTSSTHVEGGVNVQVYQLTSTAAQGTVGTIDRVERQLQATVGR